MMERKNVMARNIGGEIPGQREILRPRTATAPQAFTRQREVGFCRHGVDNSQHGPYNPAGGMG